MDETFQTHLEKRIYQSDIAIILDIGTKNETFSPVHCSPVDCRYCLNNVPLFSFWRCACAFQTIDFPMLFIIMHFV